ncbi:hypothetical protein RQP46_010864 [Phenoliferia psychrophenolica]
MQITNNDIGPSGHAPSGVNQFRRDNTGTYAPGQWADGISLACQGSTVSGNTITDATDGAIVIFGAPGSIITSNTIISQNRQLLGGINMVDFGSFSGSFQGTVVNRNIIWAKGSMIKMGVAIGGMVWGVDNRTESRTHGGTVTGNSFLSSGTGYFHYAIGAAGHNGAVVSGNNARRGSYGGVDSGACFPAFPLPSPQALGVGVEVAGAALRAAIPFWPAPASESPPPTEFTPFPDSTPENPIEEPHTKSWVAPPASGKSFAHLLAQAAGPPPPQPAITPSTSLPLPLANEFAQYESNKLPAPSSGSQESSHNRLSTISEESSQRGSPPPATLDSAPQGAKTLSRASSSSSLSSLASDSNDVPRSLLRSDAPPPPPRQTPSPSGTPQAPPSPVREIQDQKLRKMPVREEDALGRGKRMRQASTAAIEAEATKSPPKRPKVGQQQSGSQKSTEKPLELGQAVMFTWPDYTSPWPAVIIDRSEADDLPFALVSGMANDASILVKSLPTGGYWAYAQPSQLSRIDPSSPPSPGRAWPSTDHPSFRAGVELALSASNLKAWLEAGETDLEWELLAEYRPSPSVTTAAKGKGKGREKRVHFEDSEDEELESKSHTPSKPAPKPKPSISTPIFKTRAFPLPKDTEPASSALPPKAPAQSARAIAPLKKPTSSIFHKRTSSHKSFSTIATASSSKPAPSSSSSTSDRFPIGSPVLHRWVGYPEPSPGVVCDPSSAAMLPPSLISGTRTATSYFLKCIPTGAYWTWAAPSTVSRLDLSAAPLARLWNKSDAFIFRQGVKLGCDSKALTKWLELPTVLELEMIAEAKRKKR